MLTGKKQPKAFEIDERIDRAEVLNETNGSIKRNANGTFNVQSQYTPEACYTVNLTARSCTCPDYKYRGIICKHLIAVRKFAESI